MARIRKLLFLVRFFVAIQRVVIKMGVSASMAAMGKPVAGSILIKTGAWVAEPKMGDVSSAKAGEAMATAKTILRTSFTTTPCGFDKYNLEYCRQFGF
jgi:hypothetical protein